MRAFLLVVAACGGVSSDPMPNWDDAVAGYAAAHCRWYETCGDYTKTSCEAQVTDAMTQTESELSVADRDQCIACMGAWSDAFAADTDPCITTRTVDQRDAIERACPMGTDACFTHDLPGDGRFGN